MRVSADDLRAFVLDALRYDEARERELRATFGTRDVRQAKRGELQKATTALMRRYERDGFIDWRGALEFGREYGVVVEAVMRPLRSSEDVDALVELAVPRLVQLQRICIDDSDGFFSDALADVVGHLDQAFELGSREQRQQLFKALNAFTKVNPGKDRGDMYWLSRRSWGNSSQTAFRATSNSPPA